MTMINHGTVKYLVELAQEIRKQKESFQRLEIDLRRQVFKEIQNHPNDAINIDLLLKLLEDDDG
jgi:hypothetical protein